MDCSNHERRRVANEGDEQDVLTGWRKMYCYTQRAGVTNAIKRRARRRERREAKRNLLDEYGEYLDYDEEGEVANSLKQIFEDYRLNEGEEPRANL